MARVAVYQHVAHEILGTLHPLLKDAGFRIRYVNYGRTKNTVLSFGPTPPTQRFDPAAGEGARMGR